VARTVLPPRLHRQHNLRESPTTALAPSLHERRDAEVIAMNEQKKLVINPATVAALRLKTGLRAGTGNNPNNFT
jgi:hypothetical protein